MLDWVEWIWFFSLLMITGYWMVIFRRRPMPVLFLPKEWPSVSVVIAHKNDTARLRLNLASIHEQDYPSFEILIVDDQSTVDEKAMLQKLTTGLDRVRLLFSENSGKKHALSLGVQSAMHEFILCTDADCHPVTNQWIKNMVLSKKNAGVVLGYSPYQKMPGFLNRLIRFETTMTGIQFMSWALAGKAYMGVGRNMLYTRALFQQVDPYQSNIHIPYGDDDLFIQSVAHRTRINICDEPASFMEAIPASSWKEWFNQKHRHLSAAHYYRNNYLMQPGLFGVSLVIHWILIPFLIIFLYWWQWFPVFLIGLLIRWFFFFKWTRHLGGRDTAYVFPFFEAWYAMYLGCMGLYALFNKKKSWN